jgi:hypothetical protein
MTIYLKAYIGKITIYEFESIMQGYKSKHLIEELEAAARLFEENSYPNPKIFFFNNYLSV